MTTTRPVPEGAIIVRKFRAGRHTLKNKENNISEDGIRLANAVGRQQIGDMTITDGFITVLPRTMQTMEALLTHQPGAMDALVLHPPTDCMGSDEMFAFMTKGVKNPDGEDYFTIAKRSNGRTAIRELFGENGYIFFRSLFGRAIERMFTYMAGDNALGVFHTPAVDMAAEFYGATIEGDLRECSYVDFVQTADGSIYVTEVWICDREAVMANA